MSLKAASGTSGGGRGRSTAGRGSALSEKRTRWPPGWPTAEFLFTTELGDPIRRTAFSERIWHPALKRAGLSGVTMHSLRHFYASLLIRHGESVKTVQARLGHASAAETLDTYSHLWPDSGDRTRAAVDSVLGRVADSLRTGTAR